MILRLTKRRMQLSDRCSSAATVGMDSSFSFMQFAPQGRPDAQSNVAVEGVRNRSGKRIIVNGDAKKEMSGLLVFPVYLRLGPRLPGRRVRPISAAAAAIPLLTVSSLIAALVWPAYLSAILRCDKPAHW
jgi:hypothetical protein